MGMVIQFLPLPNTHIMSRSPNPYEEVNPSLIRCTWCTHLGEGVPEWLYPSCSVSQCKEDMSYTYGNIANKRIYNNNTRR